MSKKLEMLTDLSQIVFDTELARLATLNNDISRQKKKIEALNDALSQRSADLSNGGTFDIATRYGADEKWQYWVRKEKTAINMEMASIAAERENQMAFTKRALGRQDVLEKLAKLETIRRLAARQKQ